MPLKSRAVESESAGLGVEISLKLLDIDDEVEVAESVVVDDASRVEEGDVIFVLGLELVTAANDSETVATTSDEVSSVNMHNTSPGTKLEQSGLMAGFSANSSPMGMLNLSAIVSQMSSDTTVYSSVQDWLEGELLVEEGVGVGAQRDDWPSSDMGRACDTSSKERVSR